MILASGFAGNEVAHGSARVGTEPDLYWGGKARWPTIPLTLILLTGCNVFMGLTGHFPWFWIGVLFASSAAIFLISLLVNKCLKEKIK
jgi:hypothetical protein